MGTTSMVHIRVEESVKKKAAAVLAGMSLSVSDVVRILLTRIATQEAVPFNLQASTSAELGAWQENDKEKQANLEVFEMITFDENIQLSSLLSKVRQGHRYTILQRGRPVADLMPNTSLTRTAAQKAVVAMQSIDKVYGVTEKALAQWIAEGRR